MPRRVEVKKFRNDQLVLRVSPTVDPSVWDETKYESFFDALCENREYQKEALQTTLRYLLGGQYQNLIQLAEENFNSSEDIQDRYGSQAAMMRHILLPDKLYCSIDLATGTGKSYVLYGLAAVLLAERIVDRVLVLCPSNTIEVGLLQKFKYLSGSADIRDSLPESSDRRPPSIIKGDESIVEGCICVENYHQVLGHVRSSIRENLKGRGQKTLVLNDEIHHVAGRRNADQTKWKEFLADPAFGFHRIVGVSGTCYADDDYFGDVVSRYSLIQAINEGTVKDIDYVTADDVGNEEGERSQIIYGNHKKNKTTYKKVKPLTIFVTKDIKTCDQLAEDWIDFLIETEEIKDRDARKKVLVVTSAPKHASSLALLSTVDDKTSPVEWIFSVSMLTEGWDVKNVFQIVPSEERAFNSKLLISQVLGRGLRVPAQYANQKIAVRVFNHDSWSNRIKHLVEEILEREKRIHSFPVTKKPEFNFTLHSIDYLREPITQSYTQGDEYDLLRKGFVKLPSQVAVIRREVEYERATGGTSTVKTEITVKMHTVNQVAAHVFERLRNIDAEFAEKGITTTYSKTHNLEWCRQMIKNSVERVGETDGRVNEENRQKILQALGPLSRGAAKAVRYQLNPQSLNTLSTNDRPKNSVAYNILKKGDASIFYGSDSHTFYTDDELSLFNDIIGEDTEIPGKSLIHVPNAYCFKTPLNIVIAESEPEKRFIKRLCEQTNAQAIEAWIKSTDRDFYPIEFSWKKGEHTKRGSFNPDFFIKIKKKIYIVEVKDNAQVDDPSEENKKKAEFARAHFKLLNEQQSDIEYHFNFLSPKDYDAYFQKLVAGELDTYQSHLDHALAS